ncbi:MAG: cysteine hydrolase [Nitrospirae bacterium]|nr:cysteine hydrolase [Nitrospirota bacterium]
MGSIRQAMIQGMISVMTLIALHAAASGQPVTDEWNTVKVPPAPEIQPVSLDPKTTALLLLDFNKQTCNEQRRPRCITSVPKVKQLLDRARTRGVSVIYSLSAGATPADIAPDLVPQPGEQAVTSGPDKFLGTDLEKLLKEKKIQTVIVAGTAAHGAVLYTASSAALRGMKVIVPVDGLSAETLYPEQYTVWHLSNAPRVSGQVTITRSDLIKF